MADDTTTLADVSYDQTAYERYVWFALRPENYFDAVADVYATHLDKPGSSVSIPVQTDLAVASAAISESADVDAVVLGNSDVTCSLIEYGNVAKTTKKLRSTSYVALDPVVENVIGYNAGVSQDTIARNAFVAGSNVRYAGNATARNTVGPDDTWVTGNTPGNFVRRAVAELRGASAPTIGGRYVAFIHPDVSYDFRGATGMASWLDPHGYSQPSEIMAGEIGEYAGVRFIETPRAPVFADAGSSTTLTDVYATIFVGRQAVVKVWSISDGGSPFPKVFPTPIVDNLRRFEGRAWYWLGGYDQFRETCLRRLESSSTIGTNS